MFGDFAGPSLAAQANLIIGNFVAADLPLGGGARGVKVAENNRALPTNRLFFSYHHFHNAYELSTAAAPNAPPLQQQQRSLERYTAGFETRLRDGLWSLEMRMPLTGGVNYDAGPGFEMNSGQVGDLAVIMKRLLWSREDLAVSGGIGISLPTGSDLSLALPGNMPPVRFNVLNETTHLLPFVGVQYTHACDWFVHAFAQLDLSTRGNRIEFVDPMGGVLPGNARLDQQNLVHLDGAIGRWLYRGGDRWLTGAAVSAELHYTSTLQDTDAVGMPGIMLVANPANRLDILNVTTGVTCEFGGDTHFRVAAVAPLNGEGERQFDAELQATVIRRY